MTTSAPDLAQLNALCIKAGLDPSKISIDDKIMIWNLRDPMWRLQNLYFVRDKEGKVVRFRPWPEQLKFLNAIWHRNIVPKARQRGFSTMVQLMMFDACLFVPNTAAAIIAQDKVTAKKIFDDKIDLAWRYLPQIIRNMNPLTTDTTTEMKWRNNSSMVVSTSTRGNTLQYLHVSELGQIAQKFPHKAAEIQSGSLPSVDRTGVIVIESTVESPDGIFSDMVRKAERTKLEGRPLSQLDYKLHFASWWDADEYEEDPALVLVTAKDHAYFDTLEGQIGHKINERKRAWYVAKRENDFAGDPAKMRSQYPATLDEAFTVSSEGLWLGRQMSKVRAEGRICPLPYEQAVPVDTWWDIGVSDDVAIWCGQQIGPFYHWLAFIEGSGEAYAYFVKELNKLGFTWGRHWLPHDGAHRRPGAEVLKTSADMLADLGLRNVEIVPRIGELTVGIEQMRDDFASYRFDLEGTAEGIKHLDNYQKQWNERMGSYSSQPLKNGHQHAADAIRQKGQMAHNLRQQGRSRPRRRNTSGMAA